MELGNLYFMNVSFLYLESIFEIFFRYDTLLLKTIYIPWKMFLYKHTSSRDYTITLWLPCLDGRIQTRGNVARVKKSAQGQN